MIIGEDDLKAIKEISLLSGVDENIVSQIFETFLIQFTFAYSSNKPVVIPFVGNIFVRYKDDEITSEGKEAIVDAFYAPHPEVKRVVGQLKDISTTNDFTSFDIFGMLKKIIKKDFQLSLEKEPFRD